MKLYIMGPNEDNNNLFIHSYLKGQWTVFASMVAITSECKMPTDASTIFLVLLPDSCTAEEFSSWRELYMVNRASITMVNQL